MRARGWSRCYRGVRGGGEDSRAPFVDRAHEVAPEPETALVLDVSLFVVQFRAERGLEALDLSSEDVLFAPRDEQERQQQHPEDDEDRSKGSYLR